MHASKERGGSADDEAGPSDSGTQFPHPSSSGGKKKPSKSSTSRPVSFYSLVRAVIKEQQKTTQGPARPGRNRARRFTPYEEADADVDEPGHSGAFSQSRKQFQRKVHQLPQNQQHSGSEFHEDANREDAVRNTASKTEEKCILPDEQSGSCSECNSVYTSDDSLKAERFDRYSSSISENLPSYLPTNDESSHKDPSVEIDSFSTNVDALQPANGNEISQGFGLSKCATGVDNAQITHQRSGIQRPALEVDVGGDTRCTKASELNGFEVEKGLQKRRLTSPVDSLVESYSFRNETASFTVVNDSQEKPSATIKNETLNSSTALASSTHTATKSLYVEEKPRDNVNQSASNAPNSNTGSDLSKLPSSETKSNAEDELVQTRENADDDRDDSENQHFYDATNHSDQSINLTTESFHEPQSFEESQEFILAVSSLSDTEQGICHGQHGLPGVWVVHSTGNLASLNRTGSSVDPRPQSSSHDVSRESDDGSERNRQQFGNGQSSAIAGVSGSDAIGTNENLSQGRQSPSFINRDIAGRSATSPSTPRGLPSPQPLSQLALSAASAVSTILATAPSLDNHLAPIGSIAFDDDLPLYYGPTFAGLASSILNQIVQSQTNNSQTPDHQLASAASGNRRRRLRISPGITQALPRRQTEQQTSQPLIIGPQGPPGYQRFRYNLPAAETRPNPPPANLFTRLGPIPAPLLVEVRTTRDQQNHVHRQQQQEPQQPSSGQQQQQHHHQQQQQQERPHDQQEQDNPQPPQRINTTDQAFSLQHQEQDINQETEAQQQESAQEEEQEHQEQVGAQLNRLPRHQHQHQVNRRQPTTRHQRQLGQPDTQPFPPPVPPPFPAHLNPNRNNLPPPQMNEVGAEQRLFPRHLQPPPAVASTQRRSPAIVRRQFSSSSSSPSQR
ncbi:hypothetical protein ElyMa_006597800 [Elysia marginata]|uniref:Uncharacterized protein n=1 Tax=Elysia marginata TaxID=1093978 RepID=A0AAV4IEU4_9GAST|nr:hypothetical protein ElyMa_006597800 [Elysia marginata]